MRVHDVGFVQLGQIPSTEESDVETGAFIHNQETGTESVRTGS